MSEKWTNRIAVCCIIGIIGILVAAVWPDREEPVRQQDTAATEAAVETGRMEGAEVTGVSEPETGNETQDTVTQMQQNTLYYYSALSEEERVIYDQMFASITTREDVILDTVNEAAVGKVFQCVMNDHPEIFYCAAYQIEKQLRNTELIRITFSPNYHMTEDEVRENQQKIDAYVEKCISGAPGTLGQYEKVKYVYEYIIRNTTYTPNSDNNQNICSVFIGGESVCQGYAKAAQYLLRKMGMEITLAYGNVDGQLHSWNLVRVDGEYYYMDPTWGDAGYVRPGNVPANLQSGESVNYEYFLITTEQLTKSHVIDNTIPLPACVATRNNYYIREGLYFTTYDEAALDVLFERAESNGESCVTFMCADAVVYQQMKEQLITEQKVFSYVKWSASVSYSYNDELYTLIFWIE